MNDRNIHHCECEDMQRFRRTRNDDNMQQTQYDAYAYAQWHHEMALWWWNTYNAPISNANNIYNRSFINYNRLHSHSSVHPRVHSHADFDSSLHSDCCKFESQLDHCCDAGSQGDHVHQQESMQLPHGSSRMRHVHEHTGTQQFAGRDHTGYEEGMSSQMEASEDEDDEEFEVEVHENFRRFLEVSEKHRKERSELNIRYPTSGKEIWTDLCLRGNVCSEKLHSCPRAEAQGEKQSNQQEDVEYVEVGSSTLLRGSTQAPDEQPGVRKAAEMKHLYGEDSNKIHSLETALQMHYDLNCDLRHPVYWPSIPLKF